jgi:hypothetical protein
MQIDGFQEVVLVDFEFSARDGERPEPICMVVDELVSGRVHRLWQDELQSLTQPPYSIGPECLVVAYFASAEIGCHLTLGWQPPSRVLDLYVEFRNLTNGTPPSCGSGLLGALTHFGLDAMGAVEKESMRELALRGGPWTVEEQHALLEYCESDVVALKRLLPHMLPLIDLPRALLRGRYMIAVARIEHLGVPIDAEVLTDLRTYWDDAQNAIIREVDADYGVFEGRTFKTDRWAQWLKTHNIPWPRLESGAFALDDDTFREMARAYPPIAPIRELRYALSQMRLNALAVGADSRNRCLLSPYRARTGRNQPSNTRFIFGPAVWLRGLIKPASGWAVAYIDWEQQEFGIAAALSGDNAMIAAYESGDPYLAFAKQAGAAPSDATKASHGAIRDQFKAAALAVQYGMGPESLAIRIGQPVGRARELLELHRRTYRKYWRWSDGAVDHAMLRGYLHTVFGWFIHVGAKANARSLQNFPMQANGAEMLRLACCLATERGVRVCAPVHDAILIEAQLDEIDAAVALAQRCMAQASAQVLDGFVLRSEAKVVQYPDRYMDARGEQMWATVRRVLDEVRRAAGGDSPVVVPTPTDVTSLTANAPPIPA